MMRQILLVFSLLISFSLSVLVSVAVQAAESDDFHAIIVSADDSFKESEAQLNYASVDAERMARALRTVGQVSSTKINIMNNPEVSQVADAVKALRQKSVKKFLFYFSGHSDEGGLHFKNGKIGRERFHAMLKSVAARTKIVILDSCFSSALKAKGVKTSKPIDLVKYDLDEPSGSVILTSSSQQEFSYESEKLKGSIFTYHLVSGLYGQADGNSDGVVTISELYQYVYAQTKYQSLVSGGVTQHPEFQSRLSGRGALVVSFPKKTNGAFLLDDELDGELTLASVNGMNFFKFYKEKGERREINVPAGGYLLTIDNENETGVGQKRLQAGTSSRLVRSDFQWKQAGRADTVKEKGAAADDESESQANGDSQDGSDGRAGDGEPEYDTGFEFGASLGVHSGFEDSFKSGVLFELNALSPSWNMLGGQWRGGLWLGGQSHQPNEATVSEKLSYSRFTLGVEGKYKGFNSKTQRVLFNLRVGQVSPEDEAAFEKRGLTSLDVAYLFQPKSWSVSWGVSLGFETSQTEVSKERKGASHLSLLVKF